MQLQQLVRIEFLLLSIEQETKVVVSVMVLVVVVSIKDIASQA